MTANLTLPDNLIIKIKEVAFMGGLACIGSSILLTNYAYDGLSYYGCIFVFQGITLFPYRKDYAMRNWFSLFALSFMSLLCVVLLFIEGGKYVPLAIALLLFNLSVIRKEIK